MMASPLSPAAHAALNITTQTSSSSTRNDDYEVQVLTAQNNSSNNNMLDDDGDSSSPFVSCVVDGPPPVDQENTSPNKPQHSRVRSGTELSPLRILSEQKPTRSDSTSRSSDMGPPRILPRNNSPRKMSPEKRFPVKVSNPLDASRQSHHHHMELEDAMKENEGLRHAIDIFEDENDNTAQSRDDGDDDNNAGPDDTIASTFSTFSAVPMVSKLGVSPERQWMMPPRSNYTAEAAASRSPGKISSHRESSSSNLLIDFTDQLRNPHRSPAKGAGQLPASHTTPNVSSTPGRRMSNLIDFDIPPMPTPRSVPSITPRELESLKSGFLSEISSLKASLSGKEAEVNSLKTAVGDAEARVGESLEKLREEQLAKERLAAEKADWEARSREMEDVLNKAKEEMTALQGEREEMERKLDESEKRREAAEMLHQEAETKMAGMRAGREPSRASSPAQKEKTNNSTADVEVAVERVARELHTLYKSKHETKVTALKKSYESRWQKKVKELETRVDELRVENKKLRSGADANASKMVDQSFSEEMKTRTVKDSASIKELKADVERLEAVVATVQRDNDALRSMLEKERVEKGELVQLAEEMMSMQQSFVGGTSGGQPEGRSAKTPKRTHDSSAGRTSALRAPGSALRTSGDRLSRNTPGLPRPRSGIMNSIEQMGSYRGRGAH